jgi:hypothetical protein
MNRLTKRIVEILEANGFAVPGGAEGIRVRRTYAGYCQRSCGAMVWILEKTDGYPFCIGVNLIGSIFPASWLLKGTPTVHLRENAGIIDIDPDAEVVRIVTEREQQRKEKKRTVQLERSKKFWEKQPLNSGLKREMRR